MNTDIERLLNGVRDGSISIDEAVLKLRKAPFEDIGYAKLDTHRALRQGVPEIIYGAGKSAEQIIGIRDKMKETGQETVLITRIDGDKAAAVFKKYDIDYNAEGRIAVAGQYPKTDGMTKRRNNQ